MGTGARLVRLRVRAEGVVVSPGTLLRRLQLLSRKPPRHILRRLVYEVSLRTERVRAPIRAARATPLALARSHGHDDVNGWWDALGCRPYPAFVGPDAPGYDRLCPGDRDRIMDAARRAAAHRVDLLGSGPVDLGEKIDWHRDYKSGVAWPPGHFSDLKYGQPGRSSDVKFPWELSRLQWLIPVGQAYVLTGDETHARAARRIIESALRANPYAGSITWSCTMEVALRIITLTWFFHVFKQSEAWKDVQFRGELLRAIYLHGDFTERHLERSDVNGNHFTADAAGLVYAGLFFGDGPAASRWLELGWTSLCDELPRQVYDDGVDFEASTAYHRLVLELFLLPALFRRAAGRTVPEEYENRLVRMAQFTAAYTRYDGSIPLIGDADDARTLPFGGQPINDHRYLLGITGVSLADGHLLASHGGSLAEVYWLLGPRAAGSIADRARPHVSAQSTAFDKGGYYVLRNGADHVFVCCARLGLGGRGGHSHNDMLAVDAMLCGVHLFADCGAYLYTSNYGERNAFRGTASHNTPRIDGEEINRFVSPLFLWSLHDDAKPVVREVAFSDNCDRLTVSHTGYSRLTSPVTPVRTVILDHLTHTITIEDEFEGVGEHSIEVPYHLAPDVRVSEVSRRDLQLSFGNQVFNLSWQGEGWDMDVLPTRISPSYGIVRASTKLLWRRQGGLAPLRIQVTPS